MRLLEVLVNGHPEGASTASQEDPMYYFAFADHCFAYECAACGALCCLTTAISESFPDKCVFGPDYRDYFKAPRGTSLWTAERVNAGCEFLSASRHCSIETTYGSRAKPSICVLFPLRVFARIQGRFVISLYFICPFEPLSTQASQVVSYNGFEHIAAQRALANALTQARDIHTTLDLEREEQIRDYCCDKMGTRSIFDTLAFQIQVYTGAPSPVCDERLRYWYTRWAADLGLPPDTNRPAFKRLESVFNVIQPLLRFEMLTTAPHQLPAYLLGIFVHVLIHCEQNPHLHLIPRVIYAIAMRSFNAIHKMVQVLPG